MKKIQEAELRVVKFELNDVIVASGQGGYSCHSFQGCTGVGIKCYSFGGCDAWDEEGCGDYTPYN